MHKGRLVRVRGLTCLIGLFKECSDVIRDGRLWLMVVDDGVGMVQGQQVYDGMPVGLHNYNLTLARKSA